jgi:hypothetical protein
MVQPMTAEDFVALVEGIRSDFQGEEDQGLLQHDMHKAEQALAGKYACDRILRRVEAKTGIRLVQTSMTSRAR